MKIIFAGTPDFAAEHLKALLNTSHEILAVFTQPDRPAGRGRHISESPVKALAKTQNMPIYQPTTLDDAALALIDSLKADIMIVIAYGLKIPKTILDLPIHGCINVHASLLPRIHMHNHSARD